MGFQYVERNQGVVNIVVGFHERDVLALRLRTGDPDIVTRVFAAEVKIQRPVFPVFQIGPNGLPPGHAVGAPHAHTLHRLTQCTTA